mmetsp:Transcript_126267/g.351824  ORF Transcript_126267/g.351824 Transcript_126267/m.351824 type:complete len:286 (-) Transcript_126267:202-1059(-)
MEVPEVCVRVVMLSGEVLAELSLPQSAQVREVSRRIADLHGTGTPSARFHLLLDGAQPAQDAVLGELGSPGLIELQLVRCAGHTFTDIADSDPAYDATFNIVVIGNQRTGKSSLMLRFAGEAWQEYIIFIGVDFKIRKLLVDDSKRVRVQICDTGTGKERFRTITSAYYRGVHAFVVAFDLGDRESFASVPSWLSEARQSAEPSAVIALVGNKADLAAARQVTEAEAQEDAQREQLAYFETSARAGTGVEAAFHSIVGLLVDRFPAPAPVAQGARRQAEARCTTC